MAFQYDKTILSHITTEGVKRSALKKKVEELCPEMHRSTFHAVLSRFTKRSYIEVSNDIIAPKEAHITITKRGKQYRKSLD